MDEFVMHNGKLCRKTTYSVDFGPKNGVAHVNVYDPCITEEAQRKRREAILRLCEEQIRRGMA